MASDPHDADLIERYGALQHRFDRLGGFTFENEIERTLTGLGFRKDEYSKPLDILSGGQRTRAVLARLLLSAPTCCCWMNPPTIWISRRWNGWKVI